MPLAEVRKALAIRRKRHRAVHVANQRLRRTAQHRRAVEQRYGVFLFIAPHKIDVISVRRKRQPGIPGRRWRDDLRVAGRGNVPQPQRLQSVLLHDVQKIVSIR